MLAPLRTRRALAAAAAAVALLAAACGDDDDSTDAADTTQADESSTTAADGAGDATLAGSVTLEVADSDLGPILTSDGRTVYAFVPDDAGPSTCTGQCAENWPPVTVDGAATGGEGVEAELGTVARDDGSQQATANGWPLYFFSGDTAPGDTNGQDVNEVWYAVGPDGEMIEG